MHRSVEPVGALPQQAQRVDTDAPLVADEAAIDVEYLNIDAASWTQIRDECAGDADAIRARVLEVVEARGKMHNPVTGSGGMLVGTVAELGAHRREPAVGTRIATLVSLSLTPLVIDEILELDSASERVKVKGRAILFGSGIYAEVPDDLPDEVTLGVLDVAGAPAWAARLVKPRMRVVVIGAGGKSGMLTSAQARRNVGDQGQVVGLCYPESTVAAAQDAGAEAIVVDCTEPIPTSEAVMEAFEGRLADIVFVCTNVPGCEGAAILSCEDDGRIVFFSMATSFTSAALVAEGLGKYPEMTIGNGYLPGHARLALDLVRDEPALLKRFGG
ncbi:MAG TPA: L-erythro-3,5-diaminohexanoate dehydrogenase [Actinomycetota bacterium]|nr:L-erythro-3,5-diaminohexanoate dehydrogenase [Actinomycetota bacterium]